jgi:hypothetical protein
MILLLEGLAVHPKLFLRPLVDRDRRLAQGCTVVLWCEALMVWFHVNFICIFTQALIAVDFNE